MTKLAVSIVLYASDMRLLAEAVDSVRSACRSATQSRPLTCTLDLVNNKPGDKDVEAIRELARSSSKDGFTVTLIEAASNGGYGAGNNLSIRRNSDADFHLVLNPDVVLEEHALASALEYLDGSPDVGLVTPQVRGFDGELQHLCKQHPTLLDMLLRSISVPWLNRAFRERLLRYEMRERDYQEVIKPVPYPTGCFMLFRRAVLESIGGFDESFFLHYEDADIGRRVSLVSQTAYVPNVRILHKWSRDSHKSWHMRWVTIRSGIRYWRKWGGLF